jgi:predicted dehydrogenase
VLDLARWLFGAEIGEVLEASSGPARTGLDGAALSLGLSPGPRLDVSLGLGPAAVHRWEIEGSEGALRFDAWPPRVSRRLRHSPGWEISRGVRAVLPIPRREPSFAPALAAFIGAVAGADPGPRPSIADGVASLRAVLAAEEAAGLS